ncbi:suppressor apc domain-containing protein 2-like [Plakobranchus ocellatus]|uniref:Suppressor apc domain-containing protein 2-like n=1 Tax=Plakobranchus ocellatus TaxID=259542 RepID=A0AAV4AF87_9GAST|nr:suppressor apc domain-containing protein 2-like [Plakobranchus ocellatus]
MLLNLLSTQDLTNMILGPIQFDDRVERESKDHRLLVSPQAYAPEWYPPYAMGNLYVLPTSLTKRMLDICENIPYINKEDAFITGILAKVFDARHINLPDRLFDRKPGNKPELCDFVYRKRLAAQGITPNFARSLWRRLEKAEMCGLYSVGMF